MISISNIMETTKILLVWWTVYLLFHVLHLMYHQMSKSINEQLENEKGPWMISISDVNMLFKVEPRMHFILNGFRLRIELKGCVFLLQHENALAFQCNLRHNFFVSELPLIVILLYNSYLIHLFLIIFNKLYNFLI